MTRPNFLARIPSQTWRVTLNKPLRFVPITSSHCCFVILWNMTSRVMPHVVHQYVDGANFLGDLGDGLLGRVVVADVELVDGDSRLDLECLCGGVVA